MQIDSFFRTLRTHPRGELVRAARVAAALACAALFAATTMGACSGDDGSGSGDGSGNGTSDPCPGGIMVDGVCEGKCTEPTADGGSRCLPENTCVGNRCLLMCDSHADCLWDGTQDCAPAVEDETNADILVCQPNEKAPFAGYFGTKCPFRHECVEYACPSGIECDPAACGGNPGACVQDAAVCGSENPTCNQGKCPDGSFCFFPVCPVAECASTHVECQTAGEADADAYCTKRDCASDDECAGGFYCAVIRDSRELCDSDPKKGNNNLCGETNEPCLAEGDFADDGGSYFEGSACILRRSCLKRGSCAPCETDLDCSLVPEQRCVQVGPDKRCAHNCATDGDCGNDYACNAGSCVPRFGACAGTGLFCEPCLDDTDCGDASSNMACVSTGLADERACIDLSFPDECTTDADCPKSPSGKPGECLDEGDQTSPGDPLYHRCYFPFNAGTSKFSCW